MKYNHPNSTLIISTATKLAICDKLGIDVIDKYKPLLKNVYF